MPTGTLPAAPRSLADVKDEPVDFNDVEVLETGNFAAAVGGKVKITAAMLAQLARTWSETGSMFQGPVKLGHEGTGSDGEPAHGWVHNLRVRGNKLIADLKAVPADVARKIITGQYRKRSAEVRADYDIAGKTYPLAFTGLALLGATAPAVDTLADIPSPYFARALGKAELQLCFARGNTTTPRELRLCAAASLENGMDPKALLDELMKMLGVTSPEELKSAIGAMLAKGPAGGTPAINAARESELVTKLTKAEGDMVALAAERTALSGRVLALETAQAARAAEDEVQAGIDAEKLTPAQRPTALRFALTDLAGFKAHLAASPKLIELGQRAPNADADAAGAVTKLAATEAEKTVARGMGKDPDSREWRLSHAEHKAKTLGLNFSKAQIEAAIA